MENINNGNITANEEGNEIDLLELCKKLWKRKKTICIWAGVGLVLGVVTAFSIPREYQTMVTLAPEINDGKTGGGNLSTFAAMAGINLSSAGGDAVSPELYPEIVGSVPFSLSLLDAELTDINRSRRFTLAEYFEKDVKSPWWSIITGLPGKIMGAFKGSDEEGKVTVAGNDNEPIVLTKDEYRMITDLKECIDISVDKQTSLVTINVTLQDPMASAILADSVANQLKEYITEYRTNKARQDLEYIEKINTEAKSRYYDAQQKYANYLDTHQGIVLYSAQTMRDRLENETTLAFNMFNQTSQQLQAAKAKVQEVTPVFATIEPAAVPEKPSAPRKVVILAGFIFLGVAGASAWILFGEQFVKDWKKEEEPEKAKNPSEPGEKSWDEE